MMRATLAGRCTKDLGEIDALLERSHLSHILAASSLLTRREDRIDCREIGHIAREHIAPLPQVHMSQRRARSRSPTGSLHCGAGSPATELRRQHGILLDTINLWTIYSPGLDSSDLARLKRLEAENLQMRRIIARQMIEITPCGRLSKN